MNFDRLFRILSYAAVFCGFLALVVSGTFALLESSLFVAVFIAAWFLEGSRWQITEYLGTAMIVLALPAFYLLYKFQILTFSATDGMLPGMLARLILTLTAIKLLQRKSDRDWMFLYLMSFFELLLAAGLSISAFYLLTFVAYAFLMVSTIILFEIKKTAGTIDKLGHPPLPGGSARFDETPVRRLPGTAVALVFSIIVLAAPIFFMLPRVGGAGIGGNQNSVNTSSGFSDTVRLGGIGTIQQNDAIVMRVRMEDGKAAGMQLRWRGVSLNKFDNQSWSRAPSPRKIISKDERDLIQVGHATGRSGLLAQTIYLEPLNTPVIFGLPRIIAVQGNFPVLFQDVHESLTFQARSERISYKIYSDTARPTDAELRAENQAYRESDRDYLELPKIDPRIAQLTAEVTSGATNRFDSAKKIENHLQTQFGYTLEMKAGGEEPLADFLFNVREGHCEYFATAMAVMLRTKGIATRVVNGFSEGEYNETAGVYVVRQRNAHSWVEVYFPGENVWVQFDPTPFAGQGGAPAGTGIAASFNKYVEALETLWIQYVVAFDDQEQRSLMSSIKQAFVSYQVKASSIAADIRSGVYAWWTNVRGDQGAAASVYAAAKGVGYLTGLSLTGILLFFVYRKIAAMHLWEWIRGRFRIRRRPSIVEFYDRLQKTLAGKGFEREPHQTPLEFAYAVDMPEAVRITEKYNSVRFGEKPLSPAEAEEIEDLLKAIDSDD